MTVAGAVNAYRAGWEDGAEAESERIFDEGFAKYGNGSAMGKAVGNIAFRLLPNNGGPASFKAEPQFSHTFGFYEEAVTDFYATHPSRSEMNVGSVLACLADDPRPVKKTCSK